MGLVESDASRLWLRYPARFVPRQDESRQRFAPGYELIDHRNRGPVRIRVVGGVRASISAAPWNDCDFIPRIARTDDGVAGPWAGKYSFWNQPAIGWQAYGANAGCPRSRQETGNVLVATTTLDPYEDAKFSNPAACPPAAEHILEYRCIHGAGFRVSVSRKESSQPSSTRARSVDTTSLDSAML